ncbi:MAG TPA: dihydrodipicolinate synthase family protein [Limnochordales bacterium]|nr:dihydrodipicolinate synthase family protein [Limnochordales bacterium]
MTAKERLQGIFSWLPTPYTADERLDLDLFCGNVEKLAQAGVHAVYTAMNAGQMQVVTGEEHRLLVDALVACRRGAALAMAGCFAPSTAEVVERIAYAVEAGVDAVAVALPWPLPLRREEARRFMETACAAAGGIPVIHYQTPVSGRLLDADDYRQLEAVGNLAATKQTGIDYPQFLRLLAATPGIFHMRVDKLVPDMKAGARGCFSAVATLNPWFMVDFYQRCQAGRWDEALAMQAQVDAFLADLHPFIQRGYHMPSLDKAITDLAGFMKAGELKRPFLPMDKEAMAQLAQVMEKHRPLLDYRPSP